MFRSTREKLESLERELKHETNQLSDRYWELDRKIHMLLDYLEVVESQPEKIKYVKKGGPEHGK